MEKGLMNMKFYEAFSRKENLRESSIFDQDKNKLCAVYYDDLGRIHEINTEPFENLEAKAEKPDELICETDGQGELVQSTITREQARSEGKRYLVVTTLLFHRNEILLQERSSEKEIDKGKLSASAHGVAKALNFKNGDRVQSIDILSLINSALEINEELRHGRNTKPFNIKIWYQSENDLKKWAEEEKINDPDTIYIVPSRLFEDEGYPLGEKNNKRTRAISMGFIFSDKKPNISIDPAEVVSAKWQKPSTFVDDQNVTNDLQVCIESCFDDYLETSIKDGTLAKHYLKKMFE